MSPDDETYDMFGFYAAHSVDELIVANHAARTVTVGLSTPRPTGGSLDQRYSESPAMAPRQHRLARTPIGGHPIIHPMNCGALGRNRGSRQDERR
jgi:hypothetical protein